ncbi:MAG: uroporphyrinogen-III synthase [Ignavibacteriales bacterium]|nr:uroporphyrinogen-III synthase [Ignavibacteriales bacterium]
MSSMRSLAGKTIVITRPKEHAEEFSFLLQNTGANVVLFPTIEFAPVESSGEYDVIKQNLQRYDGFIFTSATAVKYFIKDLEESHRKLIKQQTVYAVGEKTSVPLIKLGITPVSLPDVYDARHLTQSILRSEVTGKRFLYPKGNLAGPTMKTELEKAGTIVDEVIVYATAKPADYAKQSHRFQQILREKKIDLITFFSASSVVHYVEMVPAELFSSAIIAVNGKTTTESAARCGLHAEIITGQPTSEGMVQAIERYYA